MSRFFAFLVDLGEGGIVLLTIACMLVLVFLFVILPLVL